MARSDSTELPEEAVFRVFFEEAEELLGILESTLLGLEGQPASEEHLRAAFRSAHTMKGNASVVGLPALVELSHGMEAVLAAWRLKSLSVTPDLITLLLECVDVARQMVAASTPAGDCAMP